MAPSNFTMCQYSDRAHSNTLFVAQYFRAQPARMHSTTLSLFTAAILLKYYFLTANTPSPFNSTENPAIRKRLATSFGTSRPLVSLLGVPV